MPRADKPKPTRKGRKPRPSRDVPHWIPAGKQWKKLPKNVRDAVSRILAPAYRRFVLDSTTILQHDRMRPSDRLHHEGKSHEGLFLHQVFITEARARATGLGATADGVA
jgi:hypothetical protein